MQRRLAGVFLCLLGVSIVSALQASPTPERAVHVYEKTLSPYTTYDYGSCDTSDLRDALNTSEMLDCKEKTTFFWEGDSLPTLAQRKELCNCTDVMDDLELSYIPRCSVFKDRMTISLAVFISYSFGLCDYTTTVSRPQESTPSPTTKEKEESTSSAPMILGIVGGVVACIIIAFIAVKCGKKRQPESIGAVPTKGDPEQSEDDDYVVHATPLSPMTGYPTSDYISVVASPKTERTNDTSTTNNSSSNSRASSGNSSQQQNVNSSARSVPVIDDRGDTGSRSSSGGRSSSGQSSQHSARSAVRTAPTPKLAMWDDPVIMAVRVPLYTVFFGPLVAQGGFGEVYKGTYRGETVAIKQLLPARRKDLVQIDAFLSEIKLMASLDHERIVRFIGVAWNSLSEVCAVIEYMENGDLRSVISRWDAEEQRPLGFDADKIKIALHVAHALTYLHSLQPVVVHRDLKSKNILLTNTYDAKLTDFGVSRERADSTMTAGVGSSLWMAPEVMMGERYNEKADVFSYGVVLSELDTQQLPYADAKAAAPDQRLPDSAILQMVSLGRLRISFSEHANQGLVELAYDCVQVDPEKRPTIAEVLYRVHQASRRD